VKTGDKTPHRPASGISGKAGFPLIYNKPQGILAKANKKAVNGICFADLHESRRNNVHNQLLGDVFLQTLTLRLLS
jgi:hypothetical protein